VPSWFETRLTALLTMRPIKGWVSAFAGTTTEIVERQTEMKAGNAAEKLDRYFSLFNFHS
jgi:hypothetical protein